jgi:hypothetical protein
MSEGAYDLKTTAAHVISRTREHRHLTDICHSKGLSIVASHRHIKVLLQLLSAEREVRVSRDAVEQIGP